MKKKLFTEIPCLRSPRLTLRGLTAADAPGLRELTDSPAVYRWLPTFLFEKQYDDAETVIARLYDEGWKESVILVVHAVGEDWGYERLTVTDKWIR